MVVSRRFEPPDLVVATLRGVLTSRDHADLLEWIRASIRCAGAVRLLIILEEFVGWHPGAPLDSVTRWLADDEGVSKIAIVGDPAWKRSVLTFIAAPIRRLPISYFDTETNARRWLGRSVPDSAQSASV
jgi:SpoIIAA-like